MTTRDRSQALLYIATAAAANYRREKQERGLLDFDDLIDKTLAMLDGGAAGWVHYKLDRGVDHVLIDEAQDTSPRQWDIVTHIISEFTSGAGARDGVRAHRVRGRRREAIDLLVPGRGSARIRRAAPTAKEEIRGRRAEIRSAVVHLFVPVGAGDPAIGRPCVSRRGDLPQHSCSRERLSHRTIRSKMPVRT